MPPLTFAPASSSWTVAGPHPDWGAAPDAIATVVSTIVEHFGWDGPVGATFPAIVRRGIIGSAANVSETWLGVNAEELFSAAAGVPFTVVNDADAAGLSEMALGAGRGQSGLVIMATLGTGIGSALFVDGTLVPNTELGHLFIEGRNAEQWASARARDREQLSWKRWARRLTTYFGHLERLFSPNEVPYNRWREYDAEDTVRFYSLRLHEVGMIKSSPQKIISQGTDWRFLNELKRELKA